MAWLHRHEWIQDRVESFQGLVRRDSGCCMQVCGGIGEWMRGPSRTPGAGQWRASSRRGAVLCSCPAACIAAGPSAAMRSLPAPHARLQSPPAVLTAAGSSFISLRTTPHRLNAGTVAGARGFLPSASPPQEVRVFGKHGPRLPSNPSYFTWGFSGTKGNPHPKPSGESRFHIKPCCASIRTWT